MASISSVDPTEIFIGGTESIQILGDELDRAMDVYFVDSLGTKAFARNFTVRSDNHLNVVMPSTLLSPGRILVFIVIGNTVVTAGGKERQPNVDQLLEVNVDQLIRKIIPPVNCIIYGKAMDPTNPFPTIWDPGPPKLANINGVYPQHTPRVNNVGIEIIGEGFAKATAVYFVDSKNKKAFASAFKIADDQRITTVIPTLSPGPLKVFVVTGDTEATVGTTTEPSIDVPLNTIRFGMVWRQVSAPGAVERYDWVISPDL